MTTLALSSLCTALLTATALGSACAVLSVIVVLRRWAFIGEGIAHAGFGGAGIAWIAALIFPGITLLDSPGAAYTTAMLFCLAVGMAIARVTRRQQVRTDTAIGIFLVSSLAFGFIASGIYTNARHGVPPAWNDFLIGQMGLLPTKYVLATIIASVTILAIVFMLGREIIYYSFDPMLAEVSGVPVGLVHYLLIGLVTVTIMLAIRMMGSLLATALLVLPGATALLLSRDLKKVMAASVIVALIGAVSGPLIHARWPYIPDGPAIVVVLVTLFAITYAVEKKSPVAGR